MENRRVLILGARSPISLTWARSAFFHGAEVYMADSLRFPVGRWSNTLSRYIYLPSPRFNLSAFQQALIQCIRLEGITDCIPLNEESFYVASIKDSLPCTVWTSDIDLLDRLHRKDTFLELASSYFEIPFTSTDVTSFYSKSLSFVFKAKYSRFASQVLLKPSATRLSRVKKDPGQWLAQEYIDGTEYCVYAFYNKGIPKYICAYRPIKRAGKGAGISIEQVHIPTLENQVHQFARSISYTGQIAFDFIEREGKYFVLECNPRGTSGALFAESYLVQVLGVSPLIEQPKSKKIFSLKIIVWFKNPLAFLSQQWRNSEDFIWDRRDIKPSFFQILSILEMLWVAIIRRIKPIDATSYDIAWNGEDSV